MKDECSLRKPQGKEWIFVILSVAAAVTIFIFLGNKLTNIDTYSRITTTLDQSKDKVLKLVGVSTASSAAITLIPGDVGTPIADKLADVSAYFLVVICAIYLEKFMLTIIGFISFRLVIPIATLVLAFSWFRKERDTLQKWCGKMIFFGVALALIIPISVGISSNIEKNFGSSIQEILDQAEASVEEESKQSESENSSDTSNENWFSNLISNVKDGASEKMDELKNILNHMLEALAVLIVTSCLIPLLVVFIFIWIIKTVFRLDWDLSGKLSRFYLKK